ncbi:MAG: hypothetical protein GX096_10295 [Clostridiales bacterium]|nr:hypothetical protein [Clostridiales bacterium]
MKKQEMKLRDQMRSAFGAAPESYKEGMRDTLASIKEDSMVKKSHFSIALAVILVILLCGTAFAMHQLGVLDFMFEGKDVTQDITDAVQSGFVQEGGDFGAVRAHVRDAVCDGIAVHAVVAYEVTDPNDVILMEYDAFRDESGLPISEPQEKSAEDGTDKWVVWSMTADVDGQSGDLGIEYQYENPQTLLIKYVIDLRSFDDLPDEIKVNWTPRVYRMGDVNEGEKESAPPITVTLSTKGMKQVHLASAQEAEFLGMKTTALEAILTPLATYVTLSYQTLPYAEGADIFEAADEWQNHYSNMWFELLDESGNPIPRFSGGSKGGNDDINPIMEVTSQVFAALPSVPSSITFQPYISYNPPAETLPTITLAVEQ